MTYCIGVMPDAGLVIASDSRTHAGVDSFSSFCKMTLFEGAGERVFILLISGNLAGTQAVIGSLKQRNAREGVAILWGAESMFDAVLLLSDAMRNVDRRDGHHLAGSGCGFHPSFILGGQIVGEPPRHLPDLCRGQLHRDQRGDALSPDRGDQIREAHY